MNMKENNMTNETYEDEDFWELVEKMSWFRCNEGGEEKEELFRSINHRLKHEYASTRESDSINRCLGFAIEHHAHELIETILSLADDHTSLRDYGEGEDYLRESLENGNLLLFNKIAESIRVRNKRKQG